MVENYIPFDLTLAEINCHFLVSDANGKSVILEYQDNEWKKTYPDKKWQVMTNKIIYHVPDARFGKNAGDIILYQRCLIKLMVMLIGMKGCKSLRMFRKMEQHGRSYIYQIPMNYIFRFIKVGIRYIIFKVSEKKTKIKRLLTKCICHKGFRGYSSDVARSNFRVGGQKTTPQSLTAHTLDR